MKKRTPAKREALPEAVRDALLGGRLAREGEQVRAGKLVPSVPQVRFGEATATLIRDGLQDWLKTGDFGRLAALLEKVPQAIAHPAVVRALRRLAEVRRRPDPEEGGYSPDDEEDPLPDGARTAADDTLRAIAGAVVSGLLGRTGWTVQPPPAKPGRPGRPFQDIYDDHRMWDAYEEVTKYLQRRKKELVRGRESRARWVAQIADLIQQAWLDSWMSEGPPDPQAPSKPSDETDTFSRPIVINHVPLPKETAAKFADKVAAGRTPDPPSEIAYLLVGHHFNKDPRSIRHRIERPRKESRY